MDELGVIQERSQAPSGDGLPLVDSLAHLVQLQINVDELYLRVSPGPEADELSGRTDRESGSSLPGLPVVPLCPPSWWQSSTTHWVARQLVNACGHGQEAWVLTGHVVSTGADGEPLIAPVTPVARLAPSVQAEAEGAYALWRLRRVT